MCTKAFCSTDLETPCSLKNLLSNISAESNIIDRSQKSIIRIQPSCKYQFRPFKTAILLDLSCNYLTSVRFGILVFLTNLNTLILKRNKIKEITLNSFPKLLQKLDLESNPLKRINPGEKRFPFQNMKYLKLKGGRINNIGSQNFLIFPSCLYLDLSKNCITSINKNAFYGMKRLETLLLWGNPIEILPANIFPPLTSLKNISLSQTKNKFLKIDSNNFYGISNVTFLYILPGKEGQWEKVIEQFSFNIHIGISCEIHKNHSCLDHNAVVLWNGKALCLDSEGFKQNPITVSNTNICKLKSSIGTLITLCSKDKFFIKCQKPSQKLPRNKNESKSKQKALLSFKTSVATGKATSKTELKH